MENQGDGISIHRKLVSELRAIKNKDDRVMMLLNRHLEEVNSITKEVKKKEKDPHQIEIKVKDRCDNTKSIFWIKNLLGHELRDIDRINIAVFSLDWSPSLYNAIVQTSREKYEKIEKDGSLELVIDGEPIGLYETLDTLGSDLLNNNGDRIENAARNYYKLIPPYIDSCVKIPEHIKKLYAESRWCYVLQNYCAAVTLCRSILELSIKHKFGYDRDSSIGSVSRYLDTAFERKIISETAYDIAKDVILRANKVLHSGKIIREKQALDVVEKTKVFFEEIFR